MRIHLAGLALGAIISMPAVAETTDAPTHVHRVFDIMREGSRIGVDTFDVTRDGDRTSVKISTHILVKVAFITAYRYDHSETESWKGDQLTAFSSTTDDNGKPHEVSASQFGGKISLVADGAAATAAKTIAPASLWSEHTSKRSQMFDPASGKRLAVKVSDLGDEMVRVNGVPLQLQHLKLSGEFARDLWFDESGLVKMTLLGSDNSTVTSQLRQTTASND